MASWNEPMTASSGAGARPAANPEGAGLEASQLQIKRAAPQSIPLKDHFMRSIDVIKHNLGTVAIAMAVVVVIAFAMAIPIAIAMGIVTFVIQAIFGESAPTVATALVTGVSFSFQTLMMGAHGIAAGAGAIFWLRLFRGQSFEVDDLKALKRFWPSLALAFILQMALTQFAGAFMAVPVIGLFLAPLLFIASIYISIIFAYVAPMCVDKNLDAIEALKGSYALMDGHKVQFILLLLLCVALNIAGILACGVGVIATAIISGGALVSFYESIAEPGNAYLDPEREGFGAQTNDVFT